jgi:hypothetical protein
MPIESGRELPHYRLALLPQAVIVQRPACIAALELQGPLHGKQRPTALVTLSMLLSLFLPVTCSVGGSGSRAQAGKIIMKKGIGRE